MSKILGLIFLFVLPLSLKAETCTEIIDGVKASFENAKKFCAESNNNHNYVDHNVRNSFNHRMQYREETGNNRPVATQFENISVCYTKTELCKSICAAGLVQQNLCTVNFRQATGTNSVSTNSSVEQLDLLIRSSEAAISCLDNSVLACADIAKEASRACMVGEEGIFRSNSQCSSAVGDIQMYFRSKDCTSVDAGEVAAFNEAKQKMLEQLSAYSKETRGFGDDRLSNLRSAEKSCSTLDINLKQNKMQAVEVHRSTINNARTARQQLSNSGR